MNQPAILETHAIFGGTFDPIHLGHLNVAQAIQNHFHFDSFEWMPCKTPVHKSHAQASDAQRIAMIQLALQDVPIEKATINLMEMQRSTPSYMVDTLMEYREKHPTPLSLVLVIGEDAFQTLRTWHRSEDLFKFCHVLVVHRPDTLLSKDPWIQSLIQTRMTRDSLRLKQQEHGLLCFFNAGSYAISSQQLRDTQGNLFNHPWLSPSVRAFIETHQLYR